MANHLKKANKHPFKFFLTLIAYLIMLLLICIFFDGNGTFIYEAF